MTEFAINQVAFGDNAGLGAWEVGHYRQHVTYNNFLATNLHVASVSLSAGGSGYTSAPGVAITGGSGSGAAATAGVSGGAVVSLTLTNPGSGYAAGDTLTVVFGGPGTGAAATATLSSPIIIPVFPILNLLSQGDVIVRKFWLNMHEQWHEQVRPFANVQSIDLSLVDFDKPTSFYEWMDSHNQEHNLIDTAFGLT
jgi:hypothetical protein